MTNLNLNTSGMDVPPAYSQITNQPGQNIPRPSSPAPSYHTIDIIRSDQAARPDSSGSESVRTSENHLGRLRRVWRTWKQAGTFGTNVEGRIEYTVLHHAARSGSVENLSRLLRQSGLQIDAQTASGRSPLHVAIMADKPAEKRRTQAFLEAGANPKLVGERGLNALQLASFYGRGAVVALLPDQRYTMDVDATLEGDVGPNTEDIDGDLGNMTAVELAARQGHIHVVSLLLDHGASPGSAGRTTVLHEVVRNKLL